METRFIATKVPAEKMWNKRQESKGETSKAYTNFCVYRDMGTGRSLDDSWWLATQGEEGTQRGSKRAPDYWKKWSANYDWVSRAAAYDDYQERILREVREKEELALRKREREESSRLRTQRLQQIKDEQWEDSCKLRDLAVESANYYSENPGKLTGGEMVKVRQQSEELRAKALDVVEMSEYDAIAKLAQSDLLPPEITDFFADIWGNAASISREGTKTMMIKHLGLREIEPEEAVEAESDQEDIF